MTVLRSGSATDVGRVRKINQDLPFESDNLYAVADGMGGHVGGEVAARVAVETLALAFGRTATANGLHDAFSEANQAVWQESQDHHELRGMGTTLTAMALVGDADGRDVLALANVGDSRAYVFSEGHVVQVTADHSLAEERVRHGEMTEEEAAVHPQRHILTRALGVSEDVDTDMWELQLRSGDRVVLCSDGLSNELSPDELGDVLGSVDDPTEAARHLVELANERGGADNITVVVVDVLVGEDSALPSTVVTPIGTRNGPPFVVAPLGAGAAGAGAAAVADAASTSVAGASDPAATASIDSLAPGAQLGFAGAGTDLRTEGPRSGEFFLGNTEAVPVARSTTRIEPPSGPVIVAPPAKESRGARRRRLGIPRRITLRVVLFILLVAAVPTGAYFAIRWYAYDNWYLAVQRNQIVIMQGHPGGVMWFHPKVVDHTGVTTSEVLPDSLTQIHSGVQEPTLGDAQRYVTNLHEEYEFLHSAATNTGPAGANSVGPSGTIPNITAPPTTTTSTTTTTVPGQPPATPTTVAPIG